MTEQNFKNKQSKTFLATTIALFAAALLTACNSETSSEPENFESDSEQMGGDPNLPDIAGENCIAELARISNQPVADISIQRVEVNETGPTHYLMIKNAAAPWICKTLPNGDVIELLYSQEG